MLDFEAMGKIKEGGVTAVAGAIVTVRSSDIKKPPASQ
jgi:hypothetical protein